MLFIDYFVFLSINLCILVMPKMLNILRMKQFNLQNYALLLLLACFNLTVVQSQMGINTTSPNGILDVNSSTLGIVLPRIALTSNILEAPVLNPQGGAIPVGTVVYNTATTSSGTDDVYPGVYVWSGSQWFPKFAKKHAEFFVQSSFFQPRSSAGYQNIPGITSLTFTAKYSGTYKIEVSMNYGTGYIVNASAGCDVAYQEGNYRFTFDGTDYIIPAKAMGTRTDSGTTYYAIWEQFSFIKYVTLVSGTSYSFDLDFDQLDSPGFVDSGNSGNGLGYIGIPDHVPCSVEFIFVGD